MTGLEPLKAAQFFRSDDYISAQHTTAASGIRALVPGAGERGAGRECAVKCGCCGCAHAGCRVQSLCTLPA